MERPAPHGRDPARRARLRRDDDRARARTTRVYRHRQALQPARLRRGDPQRAHGLGPRAAAHSRQRTEKQNQRPADAVAADASGRGASSRKTDWSSRNWSISPADRRNGVRWDRVQADSSGTSSTPNGSGVPTCRRPERQWRKIARVVRRRDPRVDQVSPRPASMRPTR